MKFERPRAALVAGVLGLASCSAFAGNNPAEETTIRGTVETVAPGTNSVRLGTHLSVRNGNEITWVMLGPAAFIANAGFLFARGDVVRIRGVRVTTGARTFVVAREVQK